jgi:DNA-binding NarL/FixJ family response regulator
LFKEELTAIFRVDTDAYETLSLRQRNILIKISKGWSHVEIAQSFRTSPGSMRMEIMGIYRTVGIINRLQTGIYMFEVDRARERL